MSKDSFHAASDVFPIFYNKLCICTGHLNLRQLKKVYWDRKLEHLKIVTSEHQHTKTTEDEEVYSNGPTITIPLIFWFLIITFNLCFYY